MRFKHWPVIAAAILLMVVAFASACNGSSSNDDLEPRLAENEQRVQQVQAQIQETQDSFQRTQVLCVLNAISATPLHEIDTNMQTATEIPAGVSGQIRRARQAAQSITWPEELSSDGNALVNSLKSFEQALSNNDLTGAKTYATQSHESWHHLQDAAYAFVAGEKAAAGDEDSD